MWSLRHFSLNYIRKIYKNLYKEKLCFTATCFLKINSELIYIDKSPWNTEESERLVFCKLLFFIKVYQSEFRNPDIFPKVFPKL